MFYSITEWLRSIRLRDPVQPAPFDLEAGLHDLKHQLTLSRELLGRWNSESDPQIRQQLIEKLGRCITRAALQVDSAVLGAQIKSAGLSPVNCSLNELVREAAEELAVLASFSGVSLKTALADGLPPVNVDPAIFPSALFNLIDNGVRYSGAGGKVLLSTALDGESVILEVRDSGPGIPPEDQAAIFDRSVRGKGASGGGSGLGLYLAKEIVARHHGRLTLRSAAGDGAVFSIALPAVRRLPPHMESKPETTQL